MHYSLKRLEQVLSEHDSCLFTQESKAGRYDVYRRSASECAPPHFICSLTDTWSPQGTPVSWGLDVVLNRIKAHDLWRDDTFIERWIKDHEKREESEMRDFRNTTESFLWDFAPAFQRATNDVNTASLNKVYPKGN